MNVDSLTLWCHGSLDEPVVGLLMGWLLMILVVDGLVVDGFGC